MGQSTPQANDSRSKRIDSRCFVPKVKRWDCRRTLPQDRPRHILFVSCKTVYPRDTAAFHLILFLKESYGALKEGLGTTPSPQFGGSNPVPRFDGLRWQLVAF